MRGVLGKTMGEEQEVELQTEGNPSEEKKKQVRVVLRKLDSSSVRMNCRLSPLINLQNPTGRSMR